MFDRDELKLISEALSFYGNKLASFTKEITDDRLSDLTAQKAKEAWCLRKKVDAMRYDKFR